MGNFKERLLEEESQLKERIEKLYDFTQSEKFEEIDFYQKGFLQIQLGAMRTYWKCLMERINALNLDKS